MEPGLTHMSDDDRLAGLMAHLCPLWLFMLQSASLCLFTWGLTVPKSHKRTTAKAHISTWVIFANVLLIKSSFMAKPSIGGCGHREGNVVAVWVCAEKQGSDSELAVCVRLQKCRVGNLVHSF